MTNVFLALGSNIEPRQQFLIAAVKKLAMLGNVLKVAPLYESAPYGKLDQDDFLNSAIILQTGLAPLALLDHVKNIEKEIGRLKRERWGPREIDIDIIFYGELIFNSPVLNIPHPDFQNRIFVLKPLADVAPDFRVPTSGLPLQQVLRNCLDKTRIEMIKPNWIPDGIIL